MLIVLKRLTLNKRMIFKLIWILLTRNNITSKFRLYLKKVMPVMLVRFFDRYRLTTNEKLYKNINIKNEQLNKIVKNFKDNGVRPQNEELDFILNSLKDPKECLDNYFILFVSGLMTESNLFRKKAICLTVDNIYKKQELLLESKKVVAALLEGGKSEEEASKFLGIEHESFTNKDDKTNENHFADMVNNNKVLILGPANIDASELEKYIKESDIIISTNITADSRSILQLANNRIKLISYYNEYNSRLMYHSIEKQLSNKVDFYVYRSIKYSYQTFQLFNKKARIINNDPFVLTGARQAIQSILYDLTKFNVKSIKILGVNLYASKNLYRQDYVTARDNILYDLGRHDLIGNFLYLKKLFHDGFFECDEILENILNMSTEEYLSVVENNFQIGERYSGKAK